MLHRCYLHLCQIHYYLQGNLKLNYLYYLFKSFDSFYIVYTFEIWFNVSRLLEFKISFHDILMIPKERFKANSSIKIKIYTLP